MESYAQDRIPVTIIKNDGTELKCNILTYKGKIISNHTFKIWVNEDKIKINRSEIKEIITKDSKYINIEYIKKTRRGGQITTKKVRRTVELLSDEKVKLCTVYATASSSNTFNSMPINGVSANTFNTMPISAMQAIPGETVLIKHYYLVSDKIIFINKVNFKKIIKKYFPDCKELNSKIKSKELEYIQIQEAVSIGNKCI